MHCWNSDNSVSICLTLFAYIYFTYVLKFIYWSCLSAAAFDEMFAFIAINAEQLNYVLVRYSISWLAKLLLCLHFLVEPRLSFFYNHILKNRV